MIYRLTEHVELGDLCLLLSIIQCQIIILSRSLWGKTLRHLSLLPIGFLSIFQSVVKDCVGCFHQRLHSFSTVDLVIRVLLISFVERSSPVRISWSSQLSWKLCQSERAVCMQLAWQILEIGIRVSHLILDLLEIGSHVYNWNRERLLVSETLQRELRFLSVWSPYRSIAFLSILTNSRI